MLHQTFQFLGQLWQLFEVSQILEFLRYLLISKNIVFLYISTTVKLLGPKIYFEISVVGGESRFRDMTVKERGKLETDICVEFCSYQNSLIM